MATSENSPLAGLLPMELPLTRSAEGSRARTSQTLASRLASRVSEAVSGPNMRASLANFDPASCSWRTSQRCLVEGWTVFSETWPRSGMMRSGIAYQLAPLAPLTSGTGSGWWPTPNASPLTNSTSLTCSGDGRTKPNKLGWAVAMWPTPHAHCHTGPGHQGWRGGVNLQTAVKMWPTPSAADDRDRGNLSTPAIQRRMAKGKQLNLSMVVSDTSGQLNPTWVEWLMGFPTGHTDLKPLETP